MQPCMMKAFAVVVFLSLAAAAADGAMNLRIFKDPKDVALKTRRRKNSCSTTASSCEPPDINKLGEQGFLQAEDGEDRCLIQDYFPGVCQGKYLEIGALDGVQYSTTYAFYKTLGWKGVNIEVDPDNYEQLAKNRRDDIANVHSAVCSESQKVHYVYGKDNKAVGGIWEYASEAHREKWWPGITLYNTIPMKCTTLQSILDQTVALQSRKYFFDLGIVDLVGAEYSALLGLEFERIGFGIIIVKKNEEELGLGHIQPSQLVGLLRSKGYSQLDVEEECGSRSVWFINEDFDAIYGRF